jgi:dipeptide/tripeptide permease
LTGAVIAVGTISWTLGTWLQDRLEKRGGSSRSQRIMWGTAILLVGLAFQIIVLLTSYLTLPLTITGWLIAGVGIGLAHSTISVLAFSLAPQGEEGSVSASLQLADQFASALCTGLGGALLGVAVSANWGEKYGILLAFVLSGVLGLLSIVAAYCVSGRAVVAKAHD